MRVGNALASKCVTGPMPLTPSRMFFHAVATSLPTGLTMPRPVTTTRRLLIRFAFALIPDRESLEAAVHGRTIQYENPPANQVFSNARSAEAEMQTAPRGR